MKPNIILKYVLILTVLVTMTTWGYSESQIVIFSDTYEDVDASTAAVSFTNSTGPIGKSESQNIADKIFTYTNTSLTEDQDVSDSFHLVYRSSADPSAILEVDYTTEAIVWNKGMAGFQGENTTPKLPSSGNAPGIAINHLTALRMLPPEELVLQHVGGAAMTVIREDGSTSNYEKLVTVYYGRRLAGLPVVGASRIVVQLGSNGELVSLVKKWTKVTETKHGQADFRDATAIRSEIEKQLTDAYPNATRIIVNESKLAMYDDGHGTVEPVVVILGEVHDEIAETSVVDWIIPALKNPTAQYPYMNTTAVDPNQDIGDAAPNNRD